MNNDNANHSPKPRENTTDAHNSTVVIIEAICGEIKRKPLRPNIPRGWPEGMPEPPKSKNASQ